MTDVCWQGWDPRGAAPLIALALAITFVLLGARLLFSELLDALPAYVVVLALWPAVFCLAAYRAITYTYRITDRALIVDRGFLSLPIAPMPFIEMKSVEFGGSPFFTLLGIGWVAVTMNDGRTVRLSSVRHPDAFSERLRTRQSI